MREGEVRDRCKREGLREWIEKGGERVERESGVRKGEVTERSKREE